MSAILAIYAMSFRLMERTSLLSDFLIITVLAILYFESLRPNRWKYILPALFLFWVNVHPVYPIGWALCFLYLFCNYKQWPRRHYRHLIILTFTSVLICLFNPRGLQGFLYPLQFATNEGVIFRQYYFEWMPTLASLFIFRKQTLFLVLLILLNLYLIYKTRKSNSFFESLASLFFIAYGLYAIRFVPTLCFALIFLNYTLSRRITDTPAFKKLNLVAASIALLLALQNIFFGYETISGPRRFGLGLDPAVVPQQAAQFFELYPQIGNVYNSHLFGSYLAWAWDGKRKLFYHGFVTDTNFFLNEYAAFSRSPQAFEQQVEKYQISAFLLDRFQGNEALLSYIVNNKKWVLGYQDVGSLIFLRKAE
ncbi:MAG: hypothetical protein H7061_11655 [Bdellovibrionaceae bacterium]|nr:hypothetical protein [Bdellovibrio sp.]